MHFPLPPTFCVVFLIIANPIPGNHEFAGKKETFSVTFSSCIVSHCTFFTVLITLDIYEDTAQNAGSYMVWHQPRQVLIDVSTGFDASPEFYSSESGHIVLKKKSVGKSGTHSPRPGTNRGAETDLKFLPIRDISAFISSANHSCG